MTDEELVVRSVRHRSLDVREVVTAPRFSLFVERASERCRPGVVVPERLGRPECHPHDACALHRSPPAAKSRSEALREAALNPSDGSIRTSRTTGRPSPASRLSFWGSRSAGRSTRTPTAPKSRATPARSATWAGRDWAPSKHRLEAVVHHVPAPVVDDHEDDVDAVLHAREHFPGMHREATVTADPDDRAVALSGASSDGHADPGPHRREPHHGTKLIRVVHLQIVHRVGAMLPLVARPECVREGLLESGEHATRFERYVLGGRRLFRDAADAGELPERWRREAERLRQHGAQCRLGVGNHAQRHRIVATDEPWVAIESETSRPTQPAAGSSRRSSSRSAVSRRCTRRPGPPQGKRGPTGGRRGRSLRGEAGGALETLPSHEEW